MGSISVTSWNAALGERPVDDQLRYYGGCCPWLLIGFFLRLTFLKGVSYPFLQAFLGVPILKKGGIIGKI